MSEIATAIFLGRATTRIERDEGASPLAVANPRDVDLELADPDTMEHIQPAAGQDLERIMLLPFDVVVGARGRLRVALARERHGGVVAGPNLFIVRFEQPHQAVVVADFLRSAETQVALCAEGTATSGVNIKDLRNLRIAMPPEDRLRELADVVEGTEALARATLSAMEARRKLASALVMSELRPEAIA